MLFEMFGLRYEDNKTLALVVIICQCSTRCWSMIFMRYLYFLGCLSSTIIMINNVNNVNLNIQNNEFIKVFIPKPNYLVQIRILNKHKLHRQPSPSIKPSTFSLIHIQKLLNGMDSLKNDLKRKQVQVNALKRRESELMKQIQQKDQIIAKQEANQFKISSMKQQIQELKQGQTNLQQKLEREKLKNRRQEEKGIGKLWQKQKFNYERVGQQLQKEIKKQHLILENCKEENNILRFQLEESQKTCKKIQKSVTKERSKIDLERLQSQSRIERMNEALRKEKKQKEMMKMQKQNLQKKLLEQQLFFKEQLVLYENEFKEAVLEIGNLEMRSFEWKNKYHELQLLISKVEGMRKQWRITKGQYCKNTQNLLKPLQQTIID